MLNALAKPPDICTRSFRARDRSTPSPVAYSERSHPALNHCEESTPQLVLELATEEPRDVKAKYINCETDEASFVEKAGSQKKAPRTWSITGVSPRCFPL